jgi:polyisoprenoid-binding protein YceI
MTPPMATNGAGGASVATTRWRIDPSRSRVAFRVKMLWGLTTVTGRFSRYEGTLDLSADPALVLAIEAASLDTGNAKRDAHLRGPDFFDAEAHPSVRYVSETARLEGERLVGRGRVHAREAILPLGVSATVRRVGDELELEAVTEVDYRELGMTWGPTWTKLGVIRPPGMLTVVGRLVRDGGDRA